MGAQSTINAGIGAVAGAALGVKKAEALKEAAAIEQANLKADIPQAKLDIAEGEGAIEEAQKNLQQAQSGRNPLGQFKTKNQTRKDIEMATLALETLQGKQEARKMQLQRMEKRLNVSGDK